MSLRAMNRHVLFRLVVAALAALLLAAMAAPAASASEPSTQAAQDRLTAVAERLNGKLGASTGGTWIDAATGALHVGVLDDAAAAQVRADGATPVRVAHSLGHLERAQAALDAVGAAAPGLSWGVDVSTNSLVITVPKGSGGPAADAVVATANTLGVPVRVESVPAAPALQAFDGGEAIYLSSGGRCSAGFNTFSRTNRQYVVTAGHCTEAYPSFTDDVQTTIGPTAASSFPTNDFGAIRISNPGSLQPSGGVQHYGGFLDIASAGRVPVGGGVCKTGSTTGTTCGTVQAYNITVNYGGGDIVYGLTQTNVCTQPGDSGGPLYNGTRPAPGNVGQGVVSGGSIGGCAQSGFRSFFQPLDEILSSYGLRLG